MQLCLIRHPRVDALQRCYGRLDLMVDAQCLAEAIAQLGEFKQRPLISSPAKRCLQLAHGLSACVEQWPELQELDFGAWEGGLWDDIPRAELDAWAADLWHYRVGGGETVHEVRARVLQAVRRAEALGQAQVLWVTHAGVIRMLLAEYHLIAEAERWTAPIDYATPYWFTIAPLKT